MQILSLQNLGNTLIAGASKGIFLSEDMGETWNEIHNQEALHYTAVVNDLIIGLYITGDVYISSDLGESWNSCSYEPRKAAYIYELVGLKDHLIMNNSYGFSDLWTRAIIGNTVLRRNDLRFLIL